MSIKEKNDNKFLQLENIHKTFPLPGGKEYKAVVDVDKNEWRRFRTDSIVETTVLE